MISDSPERRKVRSRKKRELTDERKHWSDSQKIEAVKTYLILGNVRLTAATLKVPEGTMRLWKSQAWWKEMEADLRTEDELQLSSRLKGIAQKSFDLVEDRLTNGNYVFDQKTGRLIRVPVNLRDAHKVAVDSVIHRDVIAARNYERLNDGQIENKLEQLAERFAELAAKKIVQIKDEERTIEMVEEILEGDLDEREDLSGNSLQRDAGREEIDEELSDLRE